MPGGYLQIAQSTKKKEVPLRCLLESMVAFQTSNLRIAGNNSLCLSYAFKIATNIFNVLFLDSFYHEHILSEALPTFGLFRRIC